MIRIVISSTSLFLWGLISIVSITSTAVSQSAADNPHPIPAFPEARGWGATALSTEGRHPGHDARARPIVIHLVTTTEDGVDPVPPGSLREAFMAVNSNYYDIIIFRVGGRIVLEDNISLGSGFRKVYIAGQTAPGEGIVVTRRRILTPGSGGPEDAVMRYMSHRKNGGQAIQWCGERMIIDHVSTSWSGSSGGGGHNLLNTCSRDGSSMAGSVTVSNMLLAEPHEAHPTVSNPSTRLLSFYRNVMMGPGHRFPMVQTDSSEESHAIVANNIIYNARNFHSGTVTQSVVDFTDNYYKPGPATQSELFRNLPLLWMDQCPAADWPDGCKHSVYWAGNRSHVNNYIVQSADDAWTGPNRELVCRDQRNDFEPPCANTNDPIPLEYRRDVPFDEYFGVQFLWPYESEPISDSVRDDILEWAGNSRRITCDGKWERRRDEYDSTQVLNFVNSTGRSQPIAFEGGFSPDPDVEPVVPVPDAGTPCVDTSGDGVPDAWLIARGYDPAAPPPLDSITVSGYLLIEHYLNGSDPNDPNPWGEGFIDTGYRENTQNPLQLKLFQNHPNPFNPVTSITFELHQDNHIRLSVYNSQGQLIAVLAEGYHSAGKHEVTFHAENLPSGVYMYHLNLSQGTYVRKMTLVK